METPDYKLTAWMYKRCKRWKYIICFNNTTSPTTGLLHLLHSAGNMKLYTLNE